MKADQYAVCCPTQAAENHIKKWLGLEQAEWIRDTVTGQVEMYDDIGKVCEGVNVAELQFCYKLGTEFEIIRYTSGPNWLQRKSELIRRPFIAHLGFHLDPGEPWPVMPNAPLVQFVTSTQHTNPALIDARKTYQYRIHCVGPDTYFKFIRRIVDGKPE